MYTGNGIPGVFTDGESVVVATVRQVRVHYAADERRIKSISVSYESAHDRVSVATLETFGGYVQLHMPGYLWAAVVGARDHPGDAAETVPGHPVMQ